MLIGLRVVLYLTEALCWVEVFLGPRTVRLSGPKG